ncbi:MAG: glycosyltransferase family 2 protein [Candidatus Hydrogenedentes bacterium]|nr:glycosyltransferase family 2 protein [Candidatus Hydrogenedentota bacterium]
MQDSALVILKRRIPPVRGLIVTHNAKGKPFASVDLKRWVRLSRTAYATPKIDVYSVGFHSGLMLDLLDCARTTDTRLSIKTGCTVPPEDLDALKEAGLLDVCLAPSSTDARHFDLWLGACKASGLPARVEWHAPFDVDLDFDALALRAGECGVVAATICVASPFSRRPACTDGAHSRRTIEQVNELASALAAGNIDVAIVGLPFCMVREALRPHCLNSMQVFQDHQQYRKDAYDLAVLLFRRRPSISAKILAILIAQHTLHRAPIDAILLPWLVNHSWFHARAIAWNKLTRHLRFPFGSPKAAATDYETREKELKELQQKALKALGPACEPCRLRRICDHAGPALQRILPAVQAVTQPGELVYSPFHFSNGRKRYYDAIDAERCAFSDEHVDMARKINELTANRPPDKRITPYEYRAETTLFAQYEGALNWLAVTNAEQLSSPLATLAPPCTVSLTFGGGMAEHIGFSFGRRVKLVCAMEACRHTLTLHVEADGRYVFLRDGIPIRPSEFDGGVYAPQRLGSKLELRLSIWNIDTSILSQYVDIWEEKSDTSLGAAKPKYSVIVVCTRYARRLQATLQCLAHQQDFDMRRLEVIVCYVPGLDATEDLVATMQMTYPNLRILRSPFPEQCVNAKGFIINESRRMASGDWIVLLDSDTLVPPRMFAEVEAVESTTNFVAPDGRKMLTPETTARILLGEIEPWRQWQELIAGPGEYRPREAHGVPIGFFQCVRAQCMEAVPYQEMDHFEGADMRFGIQIWEKFGAPVRVLGYPVLHLDHGGSQWYGTQKHR